MQRQGFLSSHTLIFALCIVAVAAGTALVVQHVPSLVEVASQLSASLISAVPIH